MKAKPYSELRDRLIPRERQIENEREAARLIREEMTLRELRKRCGLTQEQVAELLGRSQTLVSKFERAGDMNLSSLRALLEAMGCEYRLIVRAPGDEEWSELRAVFGDTETQALGAGSPSS